MEWATPRRAAFVILRAFLVGAVLGTAMWLTGLVPSLRVALSINMAFAGVMWSSFELLSPWYHPPTTGTTSPGRVAAVALLKIVSLYSVLVPICLGLIYVTSGFNFLRYPVMVLFSYLFGLVFTAFMNSLYTTSSLVETERARAHAEVDRLRLQLIEKDHARQAQELEEARAFQLSMLPVDSPPRTDVAIAFGMRTATEVGGDYYDVREAGDGRLELVLGDATGHGTRAGLLVVAAKTLFQTELESGTPASALARANLGVKSLNLSRMNMALTRVSVGTGTLRLSAAGMPPALHYRAASRSLQEIVSDAPPAGQLRRARYADREVPFVTGDRLVLFSDGFPECLDPRGDHLGYEGAFAAVQAVAERSPREIVDALFVATDAWAKGRPYEDDVTFLVIAAI